MSDWMTASWWAGGILALIALGVIALALCRDRSRGRRRCPRCWYDMSGVAITCPECGSTTKKERAFFRTRRSWRRAASGSLILALAGAIALGPAVYTGAWGRYTPVPIARFVLGLFEADMARVRKAATTGAGAATLSAWERLLLARSLAHSLEADLARPIEPDVPDPAVLLGTRPMPDQELHHAPARVLVPAAVQEIHHHPAHDPSPAVRTEAVTVIRWVPDDALRTDIGVAAMEDPDPGVRLAAVQTLGGLTPSSEGARRAIARAANDPDEQVRLEARRILERKGEAGTGRAP